MKSLFLFVITFLAITSSFAQKFEIGANIGGSVTNILDPGSGNPYIVYGWGGLDLPQISLKGMRVNKKWQYGLSVDYCSFSVRSKVGTPGDLFGHPPGVPEVHPVEILTGRSFCIPVKLFANRKILLNNFEPYTGFSLGYVFWRDISLESMQNDFTYSLCLLFGCTYFVTNRLGINAELACDYIYLQRPISIAFSFISVPATLGIRYKL